MNLNHIDLQDTDPHRAGHALQPAHDEPVATFITVARLRAENARLRSLLFPVMAQRAWEGLVNGAVGTLVGVAIALSLRGPW